MFFPFYSVMMDSGVYFYNLVSVYPPLSMAAPRHLIHSTKGILLFSACDVTTAASSAWKLNRRDILPEGSGLPVAARMSDLMDRQKQDGGNHKRTCLGGADTFNFFEL